MRVFPRLVLAALLLWACGDQATPASPQIYVPASWKEHREGPGHRRHLQADVQCQECHLASKTEFNKPAPLICERCHEQKDNSHTSVDAPADQCMECHSFETKSEVAPQACERCHEPEPKESRAHQEQCTECHQPHSKPPFNAVACVRCHKETPAKVHSRLTKDAERCASCHEAHQPKTATERTCYRCHQAHRSAPIKGHPQCQTCHPGHKPRPSCESCHEGHQTEQHERCETCHDPHLPQLLAKSRCSECHGGLRVTHGEGQTACTDCHKPHDGKKARCSDCHKESVKDDALHASHARCADCHQNHRLERAESQGDCARCHAQRTAQIMPAHVQCADCHRQAAHFPKLPTRSCTRCHQEKAEGVPEGHVRCRLCHEPHLGNLKKQGCIDCHKRGPDLHEEVRPCERCHAAHPEKASLIEGNGAPGGWRSSQGRAGWRPPGVQATRSRDAMNAVGGAGPAALRPGGCISCHPQRQGLHGIEGHGACVDCHRAHELKVRTDRRACARCHKMEAHEPRAMVCTGCHPFK